MADEYVTKILSTVSSLNTAKKKHKLYVILQSNITEKVNDFRKVVSFWVKVFIDYVIWK